MYPVKVNCAEDYHLVVQALASHLPFGERVTAGIECIVESAKKSTEMSHFKTRKLLLSEVVTMRRFWLTKVDFDRA